MSMMASSTHWAAKAMMCFAVHRGYTVYAVMGLPNRSSTPQSYSNSNCVVVQFKTKVLVGYRTQPYWQRLPASIYLYELVYLVSSTIRADILCVKNIKSMPIKMCKIMHTKYK